MTAEPDGEIGKALVRQAFEYWIGPEIKRREVDGTLPKGFKLWAAQIILTPDADAPEVRLNEEVKALFATPIGSKQYKKGDEIAPADLGELEAIHLTPADPNAGHITMVLWRKNEWRIGFDFRYNAARVSAHTSAAREFLDSASAALDRRQMRAFTDNLHSATELLAKGRLLLLPGREAVEAKSHGFVHSRTNLHSKRGLVESRYADLLNKLAALRTPARYLSSEFTVDHETAEELLRIGEELYQDLNERTPRRIGEG